MNLGIYKDKHIILLLLLGEFADKHNLNYTRYIESELNNLVQPYFTEV